MGLFVCHIPEPAPGYGLLTDKSFHIYPNHRFELTGRLPANMKGLQEISVILFVPVHKIQILSLKTDGLTP